MPPKKSVSAPKKKVANSKSSPIQNTTGPTFEALFGGNPFGNGDPLGQGDTIFAALRFYLISNFRQVMSQAYTEIGLIQTVVDVPVDDAIRGGILIKSKQLSEDQIQILSNDMKYDPESDHDDTESLMYGVIAQSEKWARLYGGAGILILSGQDPRVPLDVGSIAVGDPLKFKPVDMWEMFYDAQITEGTDPSGLDIKEFDYYNYYGNQIHKSRFIKMPGIRPTSFIRPRLRGWGLSIVETLVRSINAHIKSSNLIFEILDEAKLDIYKMKNLVNNLMTADGGALVRRRVHEANAMKNYKHALVIDSEDEYDQKQVTFSGFAEIMRELRIGVSSDMRMPGVKLWGSTDSGGGLARAGEDELEVYNGMVESSVRAKLYRPITKILQIKCQQKWGMVPTDLEIDFHPMRVLSAEQAENVKNSKFNRLMASLDKGLISQKQFADACNNENLLPAKIETQNLSLEPGTPEKDEGKSEDNNG